MFMDKMREEHVREMEQIRIAIARTRSEYARRDLIKGLLRKTKELALYDKLKKSEKNMKINVDKVRTFW